MVNDAEQTARSAEQSTSNGAGMCLQWSRERAAIGSKYPDASTAWRNATNKHAGDRNPPRGAMCYWTGGTKGYGHIAPALGKGKVRSSDAGGAGKPATVELGWVESHWGLPYVGWADNVNDVRIPGVGNGEDEMNLDDEIADWSPDDGTQGKTTVGKTLNQARGYSEDAYQRIVKLESKVETLTKTVDKIAKAVGAA